MGGKRRSGSKNKQKKNKGNKGGKTNKKTRKGGKAKARSGKKGNKRRNKNTKPRKKSVKKNNDKRQKNKVIRKKKNGDRRQTKSQKCSRQDGADDSTCLANIETAMDYEGNQIKNFNNQKKRVEDFDKLMKNKGGKKDNFKNTTSYMKEALGSDEKCSGTSDQTDASDAVSTYGTLNNCSTSVESGCDIPTDTYSSSELASCETSLKSVSTKNAEC